MPSETSLMAPGRMRLDLATTRSEEASETRVSSSWTGSLPMHPPTISKRWRRDEHGVHPDGAGEDRHVVRHAPAHQLFPDRLRRIPGQQARKTGAANFEGSEFRRPLRPFDTLIDPAE